MDKLTGNKAVIASGAHFKGQIKNARAIEINGTVEADLNADKLTIGAGGKFIGAANVELVVISGYYDGKMEAGSIWATATAEISGKVNYQTMQLDRGAALNCHFVHNWKPENKATKKNADLGGGDDDANQQNDQIANEIAEDVQAKKKGAKAKTKKGGAADNAKVVAREMGEKTMNVSSDFRLFADRPKKAQLEKGEKARGGRISIFGFGSKAAKATDA